MIGVARVLLGLGLLHRSACMPDDWIRGQDGGCRVLVSERLGDGGMFGAGYRQCEESSIPTAARRADRSFCTEEPTPIGDGLSWRIPVPSDLGWFVTAEVGEFRGEGLPVEECPEFRYRIGLTGSKKEKAASLRGAPDRQQEEDVIWTAPGPGTYRVEGAFAEGMSIIYYYGHDITVPERGNNVSRTTPASPA
jgi:hypothetical protein